MEILKREEYFSVSKDSKIAVYGAGDQGIKTVDRLRDKNYHVESIIDQNPPYLLYKDIPLIKPADISRYDNVEDLVIFICIRNGIAHEQIAEMFYNYGIERLVFVPTGRALYKLSEYRENYRFMIMGEFEKMKKVPIYTLEKNQDLISVEDNYVVFWCPYKVLHARKFNKKSPFDSPKNYVDIKIEEADYFFDLFHYLMGNEDVDISNYMILQGYHTKEQQKQMLEGRISVFKVYEYAIKYDPLFFVSSPVMCEYRGKGTFYINDGAHRTVYLMINGYEKVPIQVSRKEYEMYCNDAGGLGL